MTASLIASLIGAPLMMNYHLTGLNFWNRLSQFFLHHAAAFRKSQSLVRPLCTSYGDRNPCDHKKRQNFVCSMLWYALFLLLIRKKVFFSTIHNGKMNFTVGPQWDCETHFGRCTPDAPDPSNASPPDFGCRKIHLPYTFNRSRNKH